MTLLDRLPQLFRSVPYNGAAIPSVDGGLEHGANCQRYAYALLHEFGLPIPPLRSSELWTDTQHTQRIERAFEPLDLLLFSPNADAYGAHVGLYEGDGLVLHLCKAEGIPAVWAMERFEDIECYCVLLGGKRVRR